jgi:hypothetical protein
VLERIQIGSNPSDQGLRTINQKAAAMFPERASTISSGEASKPSHDGEAELNG